MATRTPELNEALQRLARATTTRERRAATQEVNRLRYPGLDPQPGRKGGGRDDYDDFYGGGYRYRDDGYPRRYSRRYLGY